MEIYYNLKFEFFMCFVYKGWYLFLCCFCFLRSKWFLFVLNIICRVFGFFLIMIIVYLKDGVVNLIIILVKEENLNVVVE